MLRSSVVVRARLLLFTLLPVTFSCATNAYRNATRADSVEAYRAFLRDHPNDEYAEPAKARLEELEFDRASQLHTVLAYKRYLEEFPDSSKAPAAEALLEGLRFNAAKAKGTAEALRQFLADHPDGAHHAEAERLLADLDARAVASSDDPKALAQLARELPDDSRREEAEARIDDRTFELARTAGAGALLDYLRRFPAGTHREAARAELFSRQIDGLLASGLVDEARAQARASPLASEVPELDQRIARAEQEAAALRSNDPLVQSAQAQNYLRSIDDLTKSLAAPDPLDRWEAAEELGQHVSVRAIEPLIRAFREARNPLIRQRAFESLGTVLKALPPRVADYEVATRLDALVDRAGDAGIFAVIAMLRDLSGDLRAAATDYQRAFDSAVPDPVILWRWSHIRQNRGQAFSAAVAARQLAIWAESVARDTDPSGELTVSIARELCAAQREAKDALATIQAARTHPTEFPEDLAAFEATAEGAERLTQARLKDAELALLTRDRGARTCDDRRIADRLAEAERQRAAALKTLRKKMPSVATTLLRLAHERDPSPAIRAEAGSLLADARGEP